MCWKFLVEINFFELQIFKKPNWLIEEFVWIECIRELVLVDTEEEEESLAKSLVVADKHVRQNQAVFVYKILP